MVQKDTGTPEFIAVLFTRAKTWKQHKCSLTEEWITNMWYIYTMEYCCSVAKWFPILCNPWTVACQASLSFTTSQSLFKFMSIELVMLSNHFILCRPLLLPSIFPSIRVFGSESALRIRWPEYWSFSFSISPSSKYSRLISFRIDWFYLLAVQGTLKSLLQHHSWKHQFFGTQLSLWSNSHPYMTTGKTIALTIQTFVDQVLIIYRFYI